MSGGLQHSARWLTCPRRCDASRSARATSPRLTAPGHRAAAAAARPRAFAASVRRPRPRDLLFRLRITIRRRPRRSSLPFNWGRSSARATDDRPARLRSTRCTTSLIIASIVERETVAPEERASSAAVVENDWHGACRSRSTPPCATASTPARDRQPLAPAQRTALQHARPGASSRCRSATRAFLDARCGPSARADLPLPCASWTRFTTSRPTSGARQRPSRRLQPLREADVEPLCRLHATLGPRAACDPPAKRPPLAAGGQQASVITFQVYATVRRACVARPHASPGAATPIRADDPFYSAGLRTRLLLQRPRWPAPGEVWNASPSPTAAT